MLDMMDPRSIFASDKELKKAQRLLLDFRQGRALTASDEELWKARKLVENTIHPATGEKMFTPGRMSAFTLVSIPLCTGMMVHGPTSLAATVFWQWVNQSYNMVFNYTNRSGAVMDWPALLKSYALAVSVSVSIALGAMRLVKRNPALRRLGLCVPFLSVITAGSCNLIFTRMEEIKNGITMNTRDGEEVGTSTIAARLAVLQSMGSRAVFLPAFPFLLPPLLIDALKRGPLRHCTKRQILLYELVIVTGFATIPLPFVLGMWPQKMSISTSSLEPHIQEAAGEHKILYANKGL